jgi:hypothetical protein
VHLSCKKREGIVELEKERRKKEIDGRGGGESL